MLVLSAGGVLAGLIPWIQQAFQSARYVFERPSVGESAIFLVIAIAAAIFYAVRQRAAA